MGGLLSLSDSPSVVLELAVELDKADRRDEDTDVGKGSLDDSDRLTTAPVSSA